MNSRLRLVPFTFLVAASLERTALAQAEGGADVCAGQDRAATMEPTVRTLMAAGSCYEKSGKLASALARYKQAQVLAKEKKDKGETDAALKVALLDAKVPKLTVTLIPADEVPGLVVKIDGEVVARADLYSSRPLDIGEHVISASANGYRSWETRVQVEGTTSPRPVRIPELDKLSRGTQATVGPKTPATTIVAQKPAATAPPAVSTDDLTWGPQRIGGVVAAGVGAVSLITGVVLGIRAKAAYNRSDNFCTSNVCTQQGLDERSSAFSSARASTILSIVGVGLIGGGAVLFFTAPTDRPRIGIHPTGIVASGSF